MVKQIEDFASRLGASISLNEKLIAENQERYFLLNGSLRKLLAEDFFYAGAYLGRTKNGKFLPSFILLKMIAERKANKIIVDKKTEWLFICGRDVFKQGIMEVTGSNRKGNYTLVLNQHGECLGFGKILCNLDEEREGVVVKNILDVGDFLRREKQHSRFVP